MLTVAFFGSDSILSLRALDAIAVQHRVVAVVQGAARRPFLRLRQAVRRIRGGAPLSRAARRLGAERFLAGGGDLPGLEDPLARLRPDVFCIAAFRWILPPHLLAIPRTGAVNLHPSLLPRHRGPWPLFWTYYHGDPEAGITLHRVTADVDAGAVLEQTPVALPRGQPVAELYARLAGLGAGLLVRGLENLVAGVTTETGQDSAGATTAPRVRAGTAMVPFDRWEVEQVWHFMAGLASHYREPLEDDRRLPVRYRAVTGFERRPHDRPPGTATWTGDGWTLYARGGSLGLR